MQGSKLLKLKTMKTFNKYQIKIKDLNKGKIYSFNGYTVYKTAGSIVVSCFDFTDKFKTLKEAIKAIN